MRTCRECAAPVDADGVYAAPRAATEPPTPADFDAMSPEEFDAYLVRNGMDARIKAALAEPVTEPLTRERLAAALRDVYQAQIDGGAEQLIAPSADAILTALTPTSAPEPGS